MKWERHFKTESRIKLDQERKTFKMHVCIVIEIEELDPVCFDT